MSSVIATPTGADDALVVNLPAKEILPLRVFAPEDAEYTPDPWVPIPVEDQVARASASTTEAYSSTYFFDEPGLMEPDAYSIVETLDPLSDTWYPAAWIDYYSDHNGSNGLYYEVGLTTFHTAQIAAPGVQPPFPNKKGPEYQVPGGTPDTWKIRGYMEYATLSETDPVAQQLEDLVLHIALVPGSLVANNGENENLQYGWIDRPTVAMLATLDEVATISGPDIADLTWVTSYDGKRRAGQPFEYDLEIDPTWVNNGRVHFAYWITKTDGTCLLETTFTEEYAVTIEWTLPSLPDGPLTAADMYCLRPPGFTTSAYDEDAALGGYWEKSGNEFWLASEGSDPAVGRSGLPLAGGLPYLGYWTTKILRFTFSQVATDDFGIGIHSGGWADFKVFTPDRILRANNGVLTTLATYSSNFAAGDEVEIFIDPDSISVRKNGVEVCNLAETDQNGYLALWALDGNSGNRISHVSVSKPATDQGEIYAFWEFDYHDTEISEFAGGPASAYRYLQAVDYPQVTVESFSGYDSLDPAVPVMWVKIVPPAANASTWFTWVNQEATDNPTMLRKDYPDGLSFKAYSFYRRPESGPLAGTVVNIDDGGSVFYVMNNDYGPGPSYPWEWFNLEDNILRSDGEYVGDPVIDPNGEYNDYAYQMNFVKGYEHYLMLDLSTMDYEYYDDLKCHDIWFYAWPRPEVYTPKIWHWGEEDDHDGFQDIGYTHEPVPLTTRPTGMVDGVAMLFGDWTEGSMYGNRDLVLGWSEETGPFSHSVVTPGAAQFTDESYTMDTYQGFFTDSQGVMWGPVNHEVAWSGFRMVERSFEATNLYYSYPGNINNFDVMWYPTIHGSGSSVSSPTVQWGRGTLADPGARLNVGPAGVDCLVSAGGPDYLADRYPYADATAIGHFLVTSDYGGLYIRGDDNMTYRIKCSRSSLIRVTGGTETTLATWAPAPAECKITLIGEGNTIRVLVDDVEVAEVTEDQGSQLNPPVYTNFGFWAKPTLGAAMRILDVMVYNSLPLTGLTLEGDRQDALVRINHTQGHSEVVGRLTEDLVWPTAHEPLSEEFNYGFETKQITVLWAGVSAVFPNSLFVMAAVNENDPGEQQYFCEVNRETMAVVRTMATFMFTDPYSGDITNPYDIGISEDGSTLYGRFQSHTEAWPGYTGLVSVVQTYNLQTEVVTDAPGTEVPIGYMNDTGLMVSGDIYSENSIQVGGVDAVLAPYEGHGYNGGSFGFDGRYLWGCHLNYHVEPGEYILTEDDVAGTEVAAGTVVDVGNGIAQAFTEVFRWDLSQIGVPLGPNMVPDPFNLPAEDWPSPHMGSTVVFASGKMRTTGPDLVPTFTEGDDVCHMLRTNIPRTPGGDNLLVTAGMLATNFSAYVRFNVIERDSGGNEITTHYMAENQYISFNNIYSWSSGGGPASMMLEGVDPACETFDIEFIWKWIGRAGSSDEEHPIGTVSLLEVAVADSFAPIEYMFNLDHEVPQSYFYPGSVEPIKDYTFSNRLTPSEWFDGATVTADGSGNLLHRFTVDMDDLPYGLNDYFMGTVKIKMAPGYTNTIGGSVTLGLQLVDADGNQTGSEFGQNVIAVASLNSATFTNFKTYEFSYPDWPLPSNAVGIALVIGGTVDLGTQIEFDHPNLIPDDVATAYRDSDPAEPDTFVVSGWEEVTDGAIEYLFPSYAFKALMAPPPAGGWVVGSVAMSNPETP